LPWEVVFYEDERGRRPVWEFMRSLPGKHRAKIARSLDLLEEFGLTLGAPHARSVKGHRKLWELRVQVARNAYRLFYFAHIEQRLVMLHGFQKKAQKTPHQEIAIAEQRMRDLLEREGST
jgi:phage-related protein